MSNTNSKVKTHYRSPISREINISTVLFSSQDIDKWKRALNNARSELMPRRKELIELYTNIIIDGHLKSVMNKRINALANKKIVFEVDGKEGEYDEKVRDQIVQTPWFYKMTKFRAETEAYGHSLVELIPKQGRITDVELIPRKVVRPEHSFMQFGENDYENGINYETDPRYSKYLIGFGDPRDLGLLETAAQYVIYKRGGFGDWAQFAELFGMPFRVGKYNQWDESSRTKLDEALRLMGGAAHAVIPDGTSLEFHDNNGTGKSEVFKDLIKICNEELSKLFLGQTMTTENGSSHSQSEVHKEVEEELMLADMIEYEYDLNWVMADKLRGLGFEIPKGHFRFDTTKQLPKEKLINVAMRVASKVPIAEEWWYKTFGVEKPSDAEIKRMAKEKEEALKVVKKEEPPAPNGDEPGK